MSNRCTTGGRHVVGARSATYRAGVRQAAVSRRRASTPRAAVALSALLLLSCACGAAQPSRFSGPLVPNRAAPEGFQGPSRGPARIGAPSGERPPWHPDPPVDPERHHVPDDGFWDALALA